MIRNKIVIGLGLMLGLTAGVSSATPLGGSSGEVNVGSPFVLRLDKLAGMAPGVYYTITCQLNNIHHSKSLIAGVELANGSMLPVKINTVDADRAGLKSFEAPLVADMNTLVLDNVHIAGATTEKKVVDVPAHIVDKTVPKTTGWWFWKKTENTVEHVNVEETYKKVSQTTYSDNLTFSAIDSQMTQLGTGYKVAGCEAVVKGSATPTSTDAPVADTPVADVPADAPVADAPVADVTPAADAPVADVPAADVTPAADAPVADTVSPINPA